MSADRALDVVVFGATGFVGRLTAEYLSRAAPSGVRVGLAGRSEPRLEEVRDGLGRRARAWPLLVADSSDPETLRALARSARVVVTTVGPYRRHGLPLVEACVDAGADYADLTGEVLFMRESIERFHDRAARAGVRIVHACGFDSIPSDLGVMLLHAAARADGAGTLRDTTLVVRGLRGGVSGGTVASLRGQLDEMRANPRVRRVVGDPYALSPDRAREPNLGPERELEWPVHDPELDMWLGPFVMASANTRVVRRSNALQRWAYGKRFRYREVTGFGSGRQAQLKAFATSGALAGFMVGMRFGPTRSVLDRVLPSPGSGPRPGARRSGFFRIDVHARTSRGARYIARVAAQGDPGYAATSVMLGESGLCLALDGDRLPARAGVLTPATAMGEPLAARLRAAGQTLEAARAA
jgi:short subunit dehydrogenase-like uncharacterized protein